MHCLASSILVIVFFACSSWTQNDVCSTLCGRDTPLITRNFQGPPGKRGPPGAPGDALQCKCSEIEDKIDGKFNKTKNLIEHFYAEQNQSSYRSCLQLKDETNVNKTGMYTIVDENGNDYKVYCDMNTDGGGWTLVATVHENNIGDGSTGKCTVGDRWSSEQGNDPERPKGDGNWENRNIFGHVTAASSDDYKNPAYFELSSRDVMVWQVPNDTPLRLFETEAYLKYRTTNGFLSRYGGSLYALYKDHYPLTSGVYSFPSDSGPAIPVVFDVGDANTLLQHFPPNTRPHVDAGYIQFRAISTHRDAFAFCPGVRNKPSFNYPSQSCLGSTGMTNHITYCGDFSGMRHVNYPIGTGWSADATFLSTTFFIFYR